MRWSLPWPRKTVPRAGTVAGVPDAWERHVATLNAHGIPAPGEALRRGKRKPATQADVEALYDVAPSFVDLLPWAEYLPGSKSMLLDDGQSVAAFFELLPIGTEGREMTWLWRARDAVENALQDSFDEFDEHPWVVQFYAQDEPDFNDYLGTLLRIPANVITHFGGS